MQSILDWLLAESANEFTFSEDDPKNDCEELLRIQGKNAADLCQNVADRHEVLERLKKWQLDKEYLSSLELHIIIARHIRACCQRKQCSDLLDDWDKNNIDLDGPSLAAELQEVIRKKLKVRAPHRNDGQETKIQGLFDLKPVTEFHNGLEKLVGFPSLNDDVVAAMKIEHERDMPFVNFQHREINPKVEWNIVVRTGKWKIDGIRCEPTTYINRRQIGLDVEHFMKIARNKYARAELNEAEVIALRLWTGPMHEKYATTIREQNVADASKSQSIKTQAAYSNTAHAINSGITKLAREWEIPRYRKVYRGYRNQVTMQQIRKDDYGCRGGVEPSFLATSESFDVAVNYSSDEAFVLEINVGQVNKGASIDWLSQFPHEKEILFNALSNVEFLGNPQVHFVKGKGRIKVYKVAISSNTKSKTLDEFKSLRKDLHINMTDVLVKQALRMIDHKKQDTKNKLVEHLRNKCEVYSNVIIQKGQNADVAVFNEGRDEYADMVRDVILFQRQSLCILDLASKWFEREEAHAHDLKNLTEWQLQALRSAFKSCEPPQVKTLILEGRQQVFEEGIFCAEHVNIGSVFTYETALATGRLLSLNPQLLTMHLEAAWATAEHWQGLFHEFAQPHTTCIHVNNLNLSQYASQSLQRLDFINQGAEQAAMLVAALVHFPPIALTNLTLQGSPIACAGAETLGRAFSRMRNLVSINLSKCMVGDRGSTGLAKSLAMLTALKALDLSDNMIGNDGVVALAPALTSLTMLNSADFRFNKMAPGGVNSNLRYLGSSCRLRTSACALLNGKNEVMTAAWSPNGQSIASGFSDGTIIVWDSCTGQQLNQLLGHTDRVNSVNWCPQGFKIASGGGNRSSEIILWNARSGEQIAQFKGHTSHVNSVVWSPDGILLASASSDKSIIIWNAQTGKPYSELIGHSRAAMSVHWSPDKSKIASGSEDKTIIIWDVLTAEQKIRIFYTSDVWSVAWSPDGAKLASGSSDKTLIIWDAQTGKKRAQLKGHTETVTSVAWSPDGSKISSGSLDKVVIVWDPETQSRKSWLGGHNAPCLSVSWSPDGSKLASASSDKTIIIWDARIQGQKAQLNGHSDEIMSLAWSPRGRKIASYSCGSRIIIWDSKTGKQKGKLEDSAGTVTPLLWSPDGAKLASGFVDGTVMVWDAQTRKPEHRLKGHGSKIFAVTWSPNQEELASGSSDNTIIIWDTQTGNCKYRLIGHTDVVLSVVWGLERANLASASYDGTIIIWDPCTGEKKSQLKGHIDQGISMVWCQRTFNLAAVCLDGTLLVLDAQTGEQEAQLNGDASHVTSLVWNPQGSKIAAVFVESTIVIWDIKREHQKMQLKGHTASVNSLVWSPDGSKLASGSSDNTVIIWDSQTGDQKAKLEGHVDEVLFVAWSPDGLKLASGSVDGAIIIWDAETRRF